MHDLEDVLKSVADMMLEARKTAVGKGFSGYIDVNTGDSDGPEGYVSITVETYRNEFAHLFTLDGGDTWSKY